jgi:hypothetical protein
VFCIAFVRAIDLDVVLQFPLTFDTRVERLGVLSVAVPMMLQQTPPFLRQGDCVFPRAGHAHRLNQPLLAEVSQVARAWVSRSIVVVPEVTTGDHSEGTHRSKRARLGASQRVLAITVENKLPLRSARQVYVPREGATRFVIALSSFAVTLGPAGVVIAIPTVLVRALPLVPWASPERSRVIVVAVPHPRSVQAPVVITIAVVRVAAAARVGVSLVVA